MAKKRKRMRSLISNPFTYDFIWDCSRVIERYQRHIKQKKKFVKVVFFLSIVTSYMCHVSASTLSKNARAYLFGVRFPEDYSQLTTTIKIRGGSSTTGGNTRNNALDRYTSTEEQVLSPPPPPLPPPTEEHSTSFIQTHEAVVANEKYMLENERQNSVSTWNMPPPPPPPPHQSSNDQVNINHSTDNLWTSPPPPPPPFQLPLLAEEAEADEITIPHDLNKSNTTEVVQNCYSSTWEVSRSGFHLLGIAKNVIARPHIDTLDEMIEMALRPYAHHQILNPTGVTEQDSKSMDLTNIILQDELNPKADVVVDGISALTKEVNDDKGIVTLLRTSLGTIQSQLRRQQQQQKKMMNVWLYLVSLSMINFQRQRRQDQLKGQFLTNLVLFLLLELYPPRQTRLFNKAMVGRDLTDNEFDSLIERIENCDHTRHDVLLGYLDSNQPTMAKVNHMEKSFALVHNDDAGRNKKEDEASNKILDDPNCSEDSDEDSDFLTEEEQRLLDESCL